MPQAADAAELQARVAGPHVLLHRTYPDGDDQLGDEGAEQQVGVEGHVGVVHVHPALEEGKIDIASGHHLTNCRRVGVRVCIRA